MEPRPTPCEDPVEHALVVKAILSGLSNCFEWDGRGSNLVREDHDLQGISPRHIKEDVIELVRERGGSVVDQRLEVRAEYQRDYRFYYRVILEYETHPRGVFVELRLTDGEDPEFPEVTIFRAHRQHR